MHPLETIIAALRRAMAAALFDAPGEPAQVPERNDGMTALTPRVVAYLAHEEGLVREAYLDSVKVWTWALGVTNASGHQVYPRYKDKPQSLQHCLEVSIWLMRERYLPPVLRAFDGFDLTEAQLAAALGFHWNTGAIGRATWVKNYCDGDVEAAHGAILNWSSGGLLTARRKREQALFFDGIWPADMRVPVYPVRKPSYTPDFRHGERRDLMPVLQQMMGGA